MMEEKTQNLIFSLEELTSSVIDLETRIVELNNKLSLLDKENRPYLEKIAKILEQVEYTTNQLLYQKK